MGGEGTNTFGDRHNFLHECEIGNYNPRGSYRRTEASLHLGGSTGREASAAGSAPTLIPQRCTGLALTEFSIDKNFKLVDK